MSVRVLPDTDRFRRDAEKDLDRIEKQLTVNIQVKPDMTGFLREMLTEIQKINQQNRQSNARKIKLFTRIDTSTMNGELAKAIRAYSNKARSGSAGKVQLPTQLDVSSFDLKISEESLRKMTDQLKDWRDHNSPQKIDLELNWPTAASAAISARLGVLTRPRTVSIVPTLNNAAVTKVATALAALSGIRVLNNLFTKFSNILKNLDKSVPIIGSLASAMAGLAAFTLSSASNLFSLSASLAQIGPTVALLPGLLGGFVVGLGVTIAALKDFNKVVPEVKQTLSELQNVISANFWAKAAQPIRDLVDGLLPQFRKGISDTATELGGFFGAFATNLNGSLSPVLAQMFTDLSQSINIATGGTQALANIIATLGEVGTSYLPQLAQWFVNISKQFSDFLNTKGKLGIKAEIDEGIQALKDLGGVLYETYGILSGVARAATEAGGTQLSTLRDALASIHDTVDSPGFQAGLVDVFVAAHTAIDNIVSASGPALKSLLISLGQVLTGVLPQAGQIIGTALGGVADALNQPAIKNGISSLFDGLQGAVNALVPALQPVGKLLGALLEVVATMLPVFAQLVTAAVVPLANALSALAPMITPLVTLLGGALTQAFTMLTPVINQLVPVVGQALGAAFQLIAAILPPIAQLFGTLLAAVAPLVSALVGALAPILPVLGQALGVVLSALQPIIAVLLQIVTAVIGPLLPMLSQIIQSILPPLAEAIQRLLVAIQPILDALLAIVNFIMPILVPILNILVTLLADTLVAAVNGVALVFEGLVEIFRGVWDMISGYFITWFGLFKGIFTGNWDTFSDGFHKLWDGIWTFLKGIWDTILGALIVWLSVEVLGAAKAGVKLLGDAFKAGWKAVVDFGKSAWSSITSGFGSFISGLGSKVVSGMRSVVQFFSDGWSNVVSGARSGFSRLVSTVTEWIGKAITEVRKVPGKARDALGDLGSTLKNAGIQLIKGFITGITGMFGNVKDALGSLTDKLTSWKGPESLDRVLLVNAGQLVIDGFIKGLESRYDAVRKSLEGLTDDVAATEFLVPGAGLSGASGGVSAAVNGAMSDSAGGAKKVLNYYAAPGSSLGSEEDLFAAANRARFGW
ncbi:phage tail protein [Streptomyces sp. NPDC002547]